MSTRNLMVFENGKQKKIDSASETIDFLSIKVGASSLEIKETTGEFDFSNKKLTDVADGATTGEVLTYDQLFGQIGQPSGIASLDGSGKVPVTQLPNAIMEYQGVWYASAVAAHYTGQLTGMSTPVTLTAVTAGAAGNSITLSFNGSTTISAAISAWNGSNPSNQVTLTSGVGTQTPSNGQSLTLSNGFDANSPTLADGGGNADDAIGNVYRAASAGTVDFGSGNLTFAIGDFVILNSSKIWEKAQTSDVAVSVTEVNGQTGVVSLTTTDIPQGTNLYFTVAAAKAAAVENAINSGTTDVAPSEDAVFNALALKRDKSEKTVAFINDNAGSITVRQVVYIKTNGHIDLARADNSSLGDVALGIVADSSIATTASGLISVEAGQIISGFTGLTPGVKYYVDASTAGAMTSTPPSTIGDHVYLVGEAIYSSTLRFTPRHIVEIAS